MKQFIFFLAIYLSINSFAQEDSVSIKTPQKEEAIATKIFYSQKLINTKTVEVLPKGVLDFSVTHNFGDIAGGDGGIKNFFGLDKATDVRIAFQIGLSDKFNLIASRAKGSEYLDNLNLHQLWELGAKWQLLQQKEDDSKHPFSLTLFGNMVVSTMQKDTFLLAPSSDISERRFVNFSDRFSQAFQIMIARKFGKTSLQLNPIYVHRNLVLKNYRGVELDNKNLLALGGAARIPISKKIIFIMDYFHPFRSQRSIDSLGSNNRNIKLTFYDAFGVGLEIVTEGHVFHLNFTNATETLENRIIPRTITRWGSGQYRWGFTISRKFVVFRDKRRS
jgi:hypothetical protein